MPSGSSVSDKCAGQSHGRGQARVDREGVRVPARDVAASPGWVNALLALVRGCQPEPAGAVTVVAVLLGVAADVGPARTVLVGAAVLAGQLSIGWCNDWLDADRDRAVGRSDKPVVRGEVTPATLRVAAVAALAVSAVLSLALGLVPGVLLLVLVASGWAYDLGL